MTRAMRINLLLVVALGAVTLGLAGCFGGTGVDFLTGTLWGGGNIDLMQGANGLYLKDAELSFGNMHLTGVQPQGSANVMHLYTGVDIYGDGSADYTTILSGPYTLVDGNVEGTVTNTSTPLGVQANLDTADLNLDLYNNVYLEGSINYRHNSGSSFNGSATFTKITGTP